MSDLRPTFHLHTNRLTDGGGLEALFMASLPGSPLKTKPLRIFVVEDHPDSAHYLRLYLELLGHSVVCANCMRQALEMLPLAECDLLLCDVFLPDGSGWDLLSLVDQNLPRPTVAVAMSAAVRTEHHKESQEAGFLHHLDKPIDPVALEAVLDQAAWMLDSLAQDGGHSPQ